MQFGLLLILTSVMAFHCLGLTGCSLTSRQQKTVPYSTSLNSLPPRVEFPENLKGKVSYNAEDGRLTFKGVMTEEERDKLLRLSRNIQYTAAVKTLYLQPRSKTKAGKRQQSTYASATDDDKRALKRVSKGTAEDSQRKQITRKPSDESPRAQKISRAPIASFEEEKENVTEEKRGSGSLISEEENDYFIKTVAAQIVTKFEEKFPPTEGNSYTVLVKPFATLDGKLNMLSYLLAEELFTLLSNSPWVGDSLQICCNPIDGGGPPPSQLDGTISGSLVQIGDEIKINARLVSADTHVILGAVTTRIPASEIAIELLKSEITPKEAVEGEDLDSKLDSLAWQIEQILKDFQVDRGVPYRLCVMDFHMLDGRRNLLGKFLVKECELRLSKNKSWRLVPSSKVGALLGGEVSSVSDLTAEEFEELAEGLGIDAVVEGTVMDLGGDIKVNVNVVDTRNGFTSGIASVDMPMDKRLEYLLSKGNSRSLASSAVSLYPGAARGGSKATTSMQEEVPVVGELGEGFFLNEDFSGPEVVNRLPDWGENLIITNERGKYLLASPETGFVNVGRKIDFPKNFSLEFKILGNSKYWNTLKFTDTAGDIFAVDFQLNDGNCYIVLPGPKSVRVRVDTNSLNRLKLVRKDAFYEIYINDTLALAGPYSKYSPFESFTITARLDQIRFADFRGKAIKG